VNSCTDGVNPINLVYAIINKTCEEFVKKFLAVRYGEEKSLIFDYFIDVPVIMKNLNSYYYQKNAHPRML
jgi:hypothetical protein